jgi:Tyrosine phosphatase family
MIKNLRTGILSMLCQSIMGISDEAIIGDYYQSDFEMRDPSAASAKLVKGRLDKRKFTGAPRKAMKDTLEFLRQKYGSVSPGYLDSIGFTCDWRDRLVACLSTSDQSIVQRIPSKL